MSRPRGRPPLVARLNPATNRPRTLYMDDATAEAARILGNGSISAGVRLAVWRVAQK